ncbi:hypothetical protein SNE40_013076 [Patella caerulea]|uniref:RanBP2-type domain-containing protein n=1 Tax=Patella caerulea TaxID=87958 RepID=A0AAN8PT61_PATCE
MESTQINEPFARTKTINEELDAHRSKLNIYSIQSQNLKPGNKVDYAKKLTAGTDTTQNLPKVPLMPPINATPVETNLNETASQISFSRSKGNLTSSLSLSQGASKVMSEIMSIQDIDKRKSTCEKSLEFLEDDILNLDQLINDILTKNDEFLKNEDFAVLNQKKSTLIKDKIMLDQYYKRLKLGTTQSMNLSEIVLYHSDIDETRQTESRMTTNLSKQFKSLQSHDIKPPLSHTVPVANNSPRTGHGIIPNISVSQQTNISSHMIETFPTTVLTNYGSMWSCQHCTYYNNVETRVCKVCNKTSVTPQIITTDAIVSSKSATDAGNDLRELKDIGNKLVDLQDQVYIEKLKAHRRFHENDVPSTAVFSSKLKPVSKQKHTSNTEDSLSSAFEVSSLSQRSSITPKSDNYSVLSNQETVELQEDKQATFQKIMKKNNETRQQNQIKYEGAELFNLVKIADKLGYDTEEIKVAIDLEQSLSGTILWLKESWQPIVDDVVFFATQCGQNLDKNNVGELSEVEAKSALKTSRGNIDVAVKECVFTRRKLVRK